MKPTAEMVGTGAEPVEVEVMNEQQISPRRSAHWLTLYRYYAEPHETDASADFILVQILNMYLCFVALPCHQVKYSGCANTVSCSTSALIYIYSTFCVYFLFIYSLYWLLNLLQYLFTNGLFSLVGHQQKLDQSRPDVGPLQGAYG